MRTIVQISTPRVPAPLLEALHNVSPPNRGSRLRYDSEFDVNDPRLTKIEEHLAQHGYSRWSKNRDMDKRTEYRVTYIREYFESDWEAAEYLEPYVPYEERLDDGVREGSKVRVIGGKDITEFRDYYLTWSAVLVAPDRTKSMLESPDLIGLSFAMVDVDPTASSPFHFERPPRQMPIEGSPFWEVVPTVKLPPLSPTMTLTDTKRKPLPPGDESAHYKATEGHYNHAELHFRRDDMASMPPFDVARTRERFGITPRTVVSQRFYRTCIQLGLRGQWVPVWIDEVHDSSGNARHNQSASDL